MRRTMAAAGVALLFGACGGDGGGTDSAVRARSTLAMGEKATFANGETVQVNGYEGDVRPEAAAGGPAGAGRSFSVVEVEACAGSDGRATAEAGKFQLEMPDGTRVPPATVNAKEPPLRTPAAPGECSRGTITYEVDRGPPPQAVSFQAAQSAVRWRVG